MVKLDLQLEARGNTETQFTKFQHPGRNTLPVLPHQALDGQTADRVYYENQNNTADSCAINNLRGTT